MKTYEYHKINKEIILNAVFECGVLVRCKDCKFIDESVKTRFFCGRLMRCVDSDWFCADGERVKK